MKKIVLLLSMGLLLFSCNPQENPDPVIPSVTTGDVTDITTTTATCGGNVTADGGAAVITRGVCWNTSENPTTSDSKTTDDLAQRTKAEDGTGMGTYTSTITGLSPNTTYYVRAYATNANGTAYGEQRTFTTNAQQVITEYTFIYDSDVEVEIDVYLFEYNEISERIYNYTINNPEKDVPYTYTAQDNAVKVKVYLSYLGFNRWVQQVYYLVEGENFDIVLTDNTIVGNFEP